MVRHNYLTCDRCDALDTNTKGEFREVTGSQRLDLCQPCWELFQVWLQKEQPDATPTEKKSTAIGAPAAKATGR